MSANRTRVGIGLFSALVCCGSILLGPAGSAAPMEGRPDLKSAGALEFSDEGALFIADSLGAAIFAVDLSADAATGRRTRPINVTEIDEKVAALLGTTPRDVVFHDMAVHPISNNVFFSLSRGRGNDAVPVLIRVGKNESIDEVRLDGVSFSRAEIEKAPDPLATTRRGVSLRADTITDLVFIDDVLYVAGLSNEEFASTLRRISYPFGEGSSSSSSVEIYHVAHGAYETHAPIRSFAPFELNGKPHLIAAYTCTPLVSIPVDALEKGTHIKGKTVAELGSGNRPLDMISFSRRGRQVLLIANSNRTVMSLGADQISSIEGLSNPMAPDNITRTEGAIYRSLPMVGVLQMDELNAQNVVMLQRDTITGRLNLHTVSKSRL